jgi:hypothetical protein
MYLPAHSGPRHQVDRSGLVAIAHNRRVRLRPAVLAAIVVVATGACSSGADQTVETTIAQGPDTLYDVTTTVADGPVIAGGVADDVATGLGVTFTDEQRACIAGAVNAAAGLDALRAYAANPSLLAQPPKVQEAIFAAVDQCLTAESYASIAAPGLQAAGASEKSATCYFRTIRDELGTAGLYRYFVEVDGEAPDTTTPVSASPGTDATPRAPATDEPGTGGAPTATTISQRQAERVLSRTYRTCGIDRSRLATTTTADATDTSSADSSTTAP